MTTRIRRRAAAPSELDGVMAQVHTEYGTHVMHEASRKPGFRHTPTGIFTLDMALFGGVPESLVTLIYGRESGGKTTLAQRIIGASQAKYPDKKAVMIDIEGTYDPTWGAVHGVDNDRMFLVQPQTGEQALDIADAVLRAEDTSVIVVDSLAALLPFKEMETSTEDERPGIQARLIGKFCRKIQNALLDERKRDHRPTVVLINQWRMKIGVFRGDPRVLPGGHAQHYVASVKVEITNKETLGRDDRDIETVDFNTHGFKIAKNKTGVGIRSGEFTMIRNPSHPLGAGFIDDARTVATWAKKMGMITGSGGNFHINDMDGKFRTLDEICQHFYSNLDQYVQFQRRLVTMQREACGLIPDGWY